MAGETVLDVGSGAGIDSFLASRKVGPSGHVIGLDMTTEMVERARANQELLGLANVEFREGKMEQIPLEEASVDVIISNGVINLSTDKGRAFRELKLYPLFTIEFLDWLFEQFPEQEMPIYLAHFRFVKPAI